MGDLRAGKIENEWPVENLNSSSFWKSLGQVIGYPDNSLKVLLRLPKISNDP